MNTACEVMYVAMYCLRHSLSIRWRDANRQFLRNAWHTCAQLRYLVSHTSFGIDRLGGDHADGMYEIPYVMGW